jgi:hypothetical protein
MKAELEEAKKATERMWCLSCGTVTRDGQCDCTRLDMDCQNLVNYADAMAGDREAAAKEINAILARAEAVRQERDELREALGERPTMHLRKDSGDPEWQQVNALFERHGLPAPDWRMRDELVGWLVWARYGEKLAGGDK